MKLSGPVETLKAADEEILITKNGRPAAVLVSADELESRREPMAIRSDPALRKETRQGVRSLKNKKAALYTLEELLK